MTFGNRLIALRKANGFKRTELAMRLNIPQTTLRNYELDVREPGHNFLIQISDLFGVSIDYLLGKTNDSTQYSKETTSLTESEMQHIKKYRALDEQGRGAIDLILNYEVTRLQQNKETVEMQNQPDENESIAESINRDCPEGAEKQRRT